MKQVILPLKQLEEYRELDPMLHMILWALINLWPADTLKITSIFRSMERDRKIKGKTKANYKRGVHTVGPPYRAMDISVYTLGSDWPQEVQRLADIINEMFVYDPARPNKVVCYVKPHGTGPHIHLQVHPNTRRR